MPKSTGPAGTICLQTDQGRVYEPYALARETPVGATSGSPASCRPARALPRPRPFRRRARAAAYAGSRSARRTSPSEPAASDAIDAWLRQVGIDRTHRLVVVHVGARIAATAGAGEVVVSSTVRDLVAGSGLELVDRGVHQLKGVDEPWRLFAVAR